MTETKCDICDKTFKDHDGLAMHNSAKHPEKVPKKRKQFSIRKIRNWAVGIIIIGLIVSLIGWGIIASANSAEKCRTQPVEEMNIGGHQNLAMHIHTHLTIIIDGETQMIPANVGLLRNIMRPIHTHDASGKLHVEAPCPRTLFLGEFFDVWGKTFNKTQLFDKTTDEGKLIVRVNGEINNDFRDLVLRDGDNIVIEYKGG